MSNAPKVDMPRERDWWHADIFAIGVLVCPLLVLGTEGLWRGFWSFCTVVSAVLAIRHWRRYAKPRRGGVGERSSSCPNSARERT